MSTYYLGTTPSGRLCSRKSNRSDFTHAAIATRAHKSTLASFSTSSAAALSLAARNWPQGEPVEVCELRQVTAQEFKAAVAAFKGED